MHSIRVFDLVGVVGVFWSSRSLSEQSEFSELSQFSEFWELSEYFLIFVIIVINNRKIMISILTVLFKKNLDERPFFQFDPIHFCGNSFVQFANNFFNQLVKSLPPF